jgi:hypothetical protein
VITRDKDRGIVIARRPIFGPKVAIYAGGIIPIALKKRIVKKESHHPRKNNPGPSVPIVISAIDKHENVPSEKVETVKFALIHTEKLSYGCYIG